MLRLMQRFLLSQTPGTNPMAPEVRALAPEAEGDKDKKEEPIRCATFMAVLEKLQRSANNHVSSKKPNRWETSNPVEGKRFKQPIDRPKQ